jgi:hypothetical protein
MKKVFIFHALGLLSMLVVRGQLRIDNATFFIGAGASVTVQGDVTSNVSIQGTGLLQLKGSATQSLDMGGYSIPNLEIDNVNDVNLLSSAQVGNSLLLTNGKLQLNAFDLTIGITANIANASSDRFIVTNGSGRLVRNSLGASDFVFPVGFGNAEFNPLIISNGGVADDIGVRCLQNVLSQGETGTVVGSDFAGNSWVITEANPGGSDLVLTGEWGAGDEPAGFNRLKSGIARYNSGDDWDLPASNVSAASGSGPFSRSRSGISSTGVFAIADLDRVNAARLNLKVFLQGAYNAGTGLMSDGIRNAGVLPIAQPYSDAMSPSFQRIGVYDGSATVNETVPAPGVFNVESANDDIVDWIYISLNDANTPAVKHQTRAALLQRDGDVVEYDTLTGTYLALRMPIDADGNYHIGVGHRNHLGVRTALPVFLQENVVTSYDFTTSQFQAYQNPAITSNPAMKEVNGITTVFALWGGNANGNTSVRASGPPNFNDYLFLINTILSGNTSVLLSNIYGNADLNMDGAIRANGPPAINDYVFLINNILNGNTTLIYNQH